MKLPVALHPLLLLARHLVAVAQRWTARRDAPASGAWDRRPLDLTRRIPLVQPDDTSCGSSVIVMTRMLRDPDYAASVVGAGDPAASFGAAALATRRRTNALVSASGRLQLPWPASLGTRPAALIRDLGGDFDNLVVDPRNPGTAYRWLVEAEEPVPLYIGEGSWMQHIVLVTSASENEFTVYDPACGEELTRSRQAFETARLDLAGWNQPWLVIRPR